MSGSLSRYWILSFLLLLPHVTATNTPSPGGVTSTDWFLDYFLPILTFVFMLGLGARLELVDVKSIGKRKTERTGRER